MRHIQSASNTPLHSSFFLLQLRLRESLVPRVGFNVIYEGYDTQRRRRRRFFGKWRQGRAGVKVVLGGQEEMGGGRLVGWLANRRKHSRAPLVLREQSDEKPKTDKYAQKQINTRV